MSVKYFCDKCQKEIPRPTMPCRSHELCEDCYNDFIKVEEIWLHEYTQKIEAWFKEKR